MRLYAFGINGAVAPVEVRESFALNKQMTRDLYRSLPPSFSAELILLSTCNRTEAYLYGTGVDAETVSAALSRMAGRDWLSAQSFLLQGEEAVRHVLHVAAGLCSLVLGDAQVLGQVKDAYRAAVEEECVGTILHRLMHAAFRAARRVASQTVLMRGPASVPAAAVALARAHFEHHGRPGLTGCRALVVGAGDMGRLAVRALAAHPLATLEVTNRSHEQARRLAEAVGAKVGSWEARHEAAALADLVIVATGAFEPTIRADHLPASTRDGAPTLLIDMARPRNVDPAVSLREGYRLIDLDALCAWMDHVEQVRRRELPAAEAICETVLGEFMTWYFRYLALQPTIETFRRTCEHIRLQETERHHHRFAESDRAELERLTKSIMQKLLAIPIVHLKDADKNDIDFAQSVRLLQVLFSRPCCEEDEVTAVIRNTACARPPACVP